MLSNESEKMKNKKYYRYFWSTICCVVLFGLIFVLLSYVMRPVTNSRKNLCGFYAEKNNSLDMVYIGGSACYAFWEPLAAWNEYGFTSFNLATDAMQPQSIKYAIREALQSQSPQVFVIDLRPFQYGDLLNTEENVINMERVAPFRNVADNMKYSKNRVQLIREGAPAQEPQWTYLFDIAKYHGSLINLINPENWKYIFNSKKLYSKGFVYYEDAAPIIFEDTRDVTVETPLEEEINTLFIDLLEYCRQEDLEVLFIVHAYNNSVADQQKYNYMKRIIEEYGLDFLNVNDFFYEIGFDTLSDFRDTNHVNLLGADKYTSFLASYLKEHFVFNDKRQDTQYVGWNRDYEKWMEETEAVRNKLKNR